MDFVLSTQAINTMKPKAVVAEYKAIEAALSHKAPGWYGFSSAYGAVVESRRLQLVERMAKEYMNGH